MGQDVNKSHFIRSDYNRFKKALLAETIWLEDWCRQQHNRGVVTLADRNDSIGIEQEVWLVSRDGSPACISDKLLCDLKDSQFTHELGLFQLEFNSPVYELRGDVFSKMHNDLEDCFSRINHAAIAYDASVVQIGTLPTLKSDDLSVDNMSKVNRYHVLNEQFLRCRHGRPVHIHVESPQDPEDSAAVHILDHYHPNVMMEACCSSFQLHWQVPFHRMHTYYNTALVVSPILVAVAGNSPLLFGQKLWEESRITVFEQAANFGENLLPRVWLGNDFLRESLTECFRDNLRHPILLPQDLGSETSNFSHLKLHNGSLWRWVRPLVDKDKSTGEPSMRMEFRCLPSGPTTTDCVANAAFFYGLVEFLARNTKTLPTFETVKSNFYKAAKEGLDAAIPWSCDDNPVEIKSLILEELVPHAREGLHCLGIHPNEIDFYLGVINHRVRSGQTGAVWQHKWLQKNGWDTRQMLSAYQNNSASGRPVAFWELS